MLMEENIALRAKQIIVVDDEPAMIRMTRRKLVRMGYEVTGFTHPEDALETVKANPDQFDLMITDMLMPGLNGAQLARAVLKLRADLPIILCSGYFSISKEESGQIGFKKFMAKPVDLVDLACAVEECLED